MAEPISFGELNFELTSSMEDVKGNVQPDNPFRIAILGDFSGRATRGVMSPSDMKPIHVDRDNLDDLIDKLNVEVHLSLEDEENVFVLKFTELDDFHPDQIYSRLDIFESLRNLRRGLNDPNTYANAASVVKSWLPSQKEDEKQPVKQDAEVSQKEMSGGSILDQIVSDATGETLEPPPIAKTQDDSDLSSLVSAIVKPHLVPAEDPQKFELIAAVDQTISQVMAAILHHPEFQAIESAWRGLDFLTRRLETGSELKLSLVDISKSEMASDLHSATDLTTTHFYKQFVEKATGTMGGEPWAVIAGLYSFEPTAHDIGMLGRICKIASQAGAPFISSADEQFLGCDSLQSSPDPADWRVTYPQDILEAWKMLRNMPESSYLGLALPGFLLRLPYGEDTDPIDMFDLEECSSPPQHQDYLWGHPAVACAYLLGSSFSKNGWNLRSEIMQDIDGLPLHIYKYKNEKLCKPCAETAISERTAATIIEAGFMPRLAFMNMDKIRLGRFQSISSKRLSGPWN